MADPRFYDNRGPFTLGEICAMADADVPPHADAGARISDLATLGGAGGAHLVFYAGQPSLIDEFAQSHAAFCFVARDCKPRAPATMVAIPCGSPLHAFAIAARRFYPQSSLAVWAQDAAIHPSAEIGARVVLAPGVVVGAGAVIGEDTRIGPASAIGRGVVIGRGCEIGGNVTISHAYIGDAASIYPGARIGQPGFGLASDARGHLDIPQIGRVIIQDRVVIGAGSTVDRGALADTVIGEGTKIDNLVQVGHNTHIGRHCVIAGQSGLSGSCRIGDFVIMGGQTALGDHTMVGDYARLAGRTSSPPYTELAGGADYGGLPPKPLREWAREMRTLALLAKRNKRGAHD